MDKFTESELIGRNKFLTILLLSNITDYEFTEDPYNWVDCYYTKNGRKTEVEIKVRSLLWSTLFMEATKLKEMKLLLKEGKADKGIYVNFINNKCYIFPISRITKANGCTISSVYANRTTAVNTGKKLKIMIEIPVRLAYIFEYTDKWHKITK